MFNFFCRRLLTSMKSMYVNTKKWGGRMVSFTYFCKPSMCQSQLWPSWDHSHPKRMDHVRLFFYKLLFIKQSIFSRVLLTSISHSSFPFVSGKWGSFLSGLQVQLLVRWLVSSGLGFDPWTWAMPIAYYLEELILGKHKSPGFPEYTGQQEEIQVTHLHF